MSESREFQVTSDHNLKETLISYPTRERFNCLTCANLNIENSTCGFYQKRVTKRAKGTEACHTTHPGLKCPECKANVTAEDEFCKLCGHRFDLQAKGKLILRGFLIAVVWGLIIGVGGYFLGEFIEDYFVFRKYGTPIFRLNSHTRMWLNRFINNDLLIVPTIVFAFSMGYSHVIEFWKSRALLRSDQYTKRPD